MNLVISYIIFYINIFKKDRENIVIQSLEGVFAQVDSPSMWTEFLTHACGNITFPQLLLWTVIKIICFFGSTCCKKTTFSFRCADQVSVGVYVLAQDLTPVEVSFIILGMF